MKFIKYFFALDFFLCGFVGIHQYLKTSQISNLFASIFCFVIAFLLFRSASKKKLNKTLPNQTDYSVEQKREGNSLNDSLSKQTSSLSDEEVPYLIQPGRDQAIANLHIPDLTRIITESYQIMRTTDNPETLCNRYKVLVEKIKKLAVFEQQGFFDANAFNQYNALISDDNFCSLILSCYQKYASKARSELKTQNGINNRINKFWKIIYNNVSAEFYNSKLQK